MSYYDNIHVQISELETIRTEIISALNYVGVITPANATYDELPDYVMKIGGVNTTNWPVDMSSIGYSTEDSRRACYRYMCYKIDNDNGDIGFFNIDNLKGLINDEIQLSLQKLSQWSGDAENFFDGWSGKFPPMLNTSNCTNFQGFLTNTSCVHYPLYDTSNATHIHGMFHRSNTPHEIPEFDFRNATTFEFGYGGSFWNTYIFSPKNIGVTPPTSYYTMLGMLAAGCNDWWWRPIDGGAIITNKPVVDIRNLDGGGYDWRANFFETAPNILACEGFENYRYSLDLGSTTSCGSPEDLYSKVRISHNSFYNIINGLKDVTTEVVEGSEEYPNHLGRGRLLETSQERTGHPQIRINYWYWNLKVSAADKEMIYSKGWDVYNPA